MCVLLIYYEIKILLGYVNIKKVMSVSVECVAKHRSSFALSLKEHNRKQQVMIFVS